MSRHFLINDECLTIMEDMVRKGIQVDMIVCDLPYGHTRNKWDSVIPLDLLWPLYLELIKEDGVIALFGQGEFTAKLMTSQPNLWRYNLIWDKVLPTGFLNANRMPLRVHEDILIFYKATPTYNPQKTPGLASHSKGKGKVYQNHNYGDHQFVDNTEELGNMKHPKSILSFQKPHPSTTLHPTQKSIELCEWLIKSYTSPGETILDNCMGVGTTGIAAMNTGRDFIGIEIDEKYFNIAKSRIETGGAY